MNCPFCHNTNTSVSYTRKSAAGIRRRRICDDCEGIFFTREEVLPITAYVIKKNGNKEVFKDIKLKNSLLAAAFKRNDLKEKIPEVIDNIRSQILKSPKQTINANVIAQLILKELKVRDYVAYLRFASVQNPNELEKLAPNSKLNTQLKSKKTPKNFGPL